MPYDLLFSNLSAPWPSLSDRLVTVGGVPVTYSDALEAAGILAASRTSAIEPVLRAAGSPLARCDYLGAAAPYLFLARQAPKTGRIGAAGRHVTKDAFLRAVAFALQVAREEDLGLALGAFAADERYAVAIARDAVALRERAYVAGVRSAVRSAVTRAVAACSAASGQFTCSAVTACGTGSCRLAAPGYRLVTVPAAAGRMIRPANHVAAGTGFTEAGAAAQVAAAGSSRGGVLVQDCDALGAGSQAA